MKLCYYLLTLLTYPLLSYAAEFSNPFLSDSPLSSLLASKLGISIAHSDNTSGVVEWPEQPRLPKFMYKLYHRVMHRMKRDPNKAMNLLGFGNQKAFANSIQIVYPISVKNGNFGKNYEMKVFNFNISLLTDNLTKGYLHIHKHNSSHNDISPLSIFAVSNGKPINLFTNAKKHSKKYFIIPVSRIANFSTNGVLTFVVTSPNGLRENYSANLILYAQDEQASQVYWSHSIRVRRSNHVTPRAAGYLSSHCQNHHLYISFREIGWSDYIKYPDGYNVNYCYGTCPVPLSSRFNVTNHSILQNSLHHLKRPSVPEACCVPTELSPITLIYADPITRRLVMKIYIDMQVTSCGCQ